MLFLFILLVCVNVVHNTLGVTCVYVYYICTHKIPYRKTKLAIYNHRVDSPLYIALWIFESDLMMSAISADGV